MSNYRLITEVKIKSFEKPANEASKVWGHTGIKVLGHTEIKVLGHTSSRNVPWNVPWNVPVTSALTERDFRNNAEIRFCLWSEADDGSEDQGVRKTCE